MRQGPVQDEVLAIDYFISESGRVISEILDVLEVIENNNSDLNHIFVKFLPVLYLQLENVEEVLGSLLETFGQRLLRLHVACIEICVTHRQASTDTAHPLRIIATNPADLPSGSRCMLSACPRTVSGFSRASEARSRWEICTKSRFQHHTLTEGLQSIQPRRHMAHIMGTQYVYDFPELFGKAIENSWLEAIRKCPSLSEKQPSMGRCIDCTELVLDEHESLVECDRNPEQTRMVLSRGLRLLEPLSILKAESLLLLRTILHFERGASGLAECIFFNKCTQYAYDRGIPRIYISANSGAASQ